MEKLWKVMVLDYILISLSSSMKVMGRLNAQLDAPCHCLVTGQQVWCPAVYLSPKFRITGIF